MHNALKLDLIINLVILKNKRRIIKYRIFDKNKKEFKYKLYRAIFLRIFL